MADLFNHPPSLADIEALARAAYDTIPETLRDRVANVVIRVQDFPDAGIERDMGLRSPFELMGLYQGVPIGGKNISNTPHDVDMITLYRRPLLDYWCETEEDLARLVRHVLIHEIGHHFGFSNDEMARLEDS